MYACMHACVDGWMDGWMHGWMDGWTDGWMDMCMCNCIWKPEYARMLPLGSALYLYPEAKTYLIIKAMEPHRS